MNYDEAMDATVTRKEALDEIRLHQIDVNEFIEECGDKEEYEGAEVLGWLGY